MDPFGYFSASDSASGSGLPGPRYLEAVAGGLSDGYLTERYELRILRRRAERLLRAGEPFPLVAALDEQMAQLGVTTPPNSPVRQLFDVATKRRLTPDTVERPVRRRKQLHPQRIAI